MVSADLLTIIMLPKIDMFKKVIFTPRLLKHHETCTPRKKVTLSSMQLYGTKMRRNKEDIISCFYLLKKQDIMKFLRTGAFFFFSPDGELLRY